MSMAVTFAGGSPAVAEPSAAHALADKFSVSETKAREAERRKAEEAEMLERARREAVERAEQQKRDLAEAEARMKELEAARAEEAKRLSEKLRRAEEARRLKAAGDAERPFTPALSKPKTPELLVIPPPQAPESEVVRRPLPSGPSDFPRSVEPPEPFEPPMALGLPRVAPAEPVDPRVTVLLVMDPGTKGIRRFNKTADPVLCHDDLCFVSTGPAAPARALKRRKALGAGNTLGRRAGACRQSLTCVFRGVTLTGSAPMIQPVDLKVLVHDRREPRTVSGDASCQAVGGRLSCSRTVVAPGYRAWIVPEAVAERAGARVLEAALTRGLTAVDLREAAVRD
jgi:colicin import membrane protein